MRILIDIIHPAHVHFFYHAITEWKKKHDILVTSRGKEFTLELLKAYGIANTCLTELKGGKIGLFKELLVRDYKLFKTAKKFNPDVLTGITGVSISHVGKMLGKPSIVFYDTEFAKLLNSITYPLASVVCTPECYQGDIGRKHIRYPGYHELAYLHPKRFTPDKSVLKNLDIENGKFFIVRFVSWMASHDFDEKGISYQNKLKLVQELSKYGRVFITSEKELPIELQPFKYPLSPHTIHHAMAFASLIIGESATMCSEAAVLGIPSIYIAKTGRGYTDEQEAKYGLVFNFSDDQQTMAIEKALELVRKPDLKEEWQKKRAKMLSERIDVTEFIVKFVEAYPSNPKEAIKSFTYDRH